MSFTRFSLKKTSPIARVFVVVLLLIKQTSLRFGVVDKHHKPAGDRINQRGREDFPTTQKIKMVFR